MARTKQATPLRREPSDFDKGPSESPSHGWNHAIGNSVKTAPNKSNGKPKAPLTPTTKDQAGLPQLLICVGGIYISL